MGFGGAEAGALTSVRVGGFAGRSGTGGGAAGFLGSLDFPKSDLS